MPEKTNTAVPTRDQLHDIADAMRDEIEDLADERNEWAWAADELAAVLAILCESQARRDYSRATRRRRQGLETPDEGAAIWTRADAALARWKAVGAEE